MTLTTDLAHRGLRVFCPEPQTLRRFQVLGERSSGTNLLHVLMRRHGGLEPSEAMGWKHGFIQASALPRDLAILAIIRAPQAWALSMHRRPWHAVPALQAMPFSQFIRSEWRSHIDRPRYFGRQRGTRGQPLLADRDPLSGACFANIFALRRAKLRALLGLAGAGGCVALLRLEMLQADQAGCIGAVLNGLGRDPPAAMRPVVRRLGARFKPALPDRPPTPARMNKADRDFMRAALDHEAERAIGFDIEAM